MKYEKSIEDDKKKLVSKIKKADKRRIEYKEEQKQITLKKNNQIYLSRMDRKNRVIRNEKAQEYEREEKMKSILERMEKIDKMKKQQQKINEERAQAQEEIREKKQIMLDRFAKVMQMDKDFTKEEIENYIFNGNPLPKVSQYEKERNKENDEEYKEKEEKSEDEKEVNNKKEEKKKENKNEIKKTKNEKEEDKKPVLEENYNSNINVTEDALEPIPK